ncbi:hypothetical protein FACS1894193_06020 [Bacilli bacterium]|nr:hypothetical protein FACS1894192_07380 [Bacilli bacterium]GHU41727.1 hypothetical protein FACS1894193_06020 [Bacilli bacterium]
MRPKMKIVILLVMSIVILTACSSKKVGDIDTKIYNLEQDFKKNYQLWVDMKADGAVQHKEYATDMKDVGNKFKSLGNTAKTTSYKKLLSDEDQKIYETYRLLGDDIYKVGYALYKKDYTEADKIYQSVLEKEEALKE